MTYKELKEKYPDKEFGEINITRTYQLINYESSRDFEETETEDRGWQFYLTHNCDEWVIGSLEEAEIFHEDLLRAIWYVKSNI